MKRSKENYRKPYYTDECSGICVVRDKDEPIESLIRRFNKKVTKSGLIKEYRERMFYEKKSDKKRRKLIQSIRAKEREREKAKAKMEKLYKKRLKEKRKLAKEKAKLKKQQEKE